VNLLRNIVTVAIALCLLVLWHNHGAVIKASFESNHSVAGVSDTLVITYRTPEELLTKLRPLKTRQKIDLQYVGDPAQMVNTGIKCSDQVAKAAFQERFQKDADEKVLAIDAELAGIQGAPR
jgi:hypothetical protein